MKSEVEKIEKRIVVNCIIATLCIILIFTLSITHTKYIEQKIASSSESYLATFSLQSAEIVRQQIDEKLGYLNMFAGTVSNLELESKELISLLSDEDNLGGFLELNLVMKNGDVLTPLESRLDQEEKTVLLAVNNKYIQKLFSQESTSFFGDPHQINSKSVALYAVPVLANGVVEGVLIGYYTDEFFRNIAWPKPLDGLDHSVLVKGDGTPLYVPVQMSEDKSYRGAVAQIEGACSFNGQAGKVLKEDLRAGKAGTIRYESGTDDMYLSYQPLGLNGWYLLTMITADVITDQFETIYGDIVPSIIYFIIILITTSIYFVYIRSQNLKRMEYRLKQQSVNDESYRMIMEQSNDIIFEYDTIAKTYYHTANFKKTFGYEPKKRGFLGFLERDYIHPDDVLRLVEMYEYMKQHQCLSETEVRIIRGDGEYIWVHIYVIGIFDSDKRLVRVIGKIEDINEKKKEMERFKEMAVMDSATGVYNKQTPEDMINLYLRGEGRTGTHAVLIIDIDDFKLINDDHGHRQGDFIISEMGNEINRIFRSTDIKGRIGGDEFMVLVKDVDGIDFLEDKAKAVCEIFKDRYVCGDKKVNVSASIGIALYDKDGTTYEELYEAADRALYTCKNIRKGTFAFHRPEDSQKVICR